MEIDGVDHFNGDISYEPHCPLLDAVFLNK